MALSAAIEWDIRSTGVDTNGGGFKAGATGTDFSQQNAAQYALTTSTSAGAGNTLLDAAAAADMVGNTAWTVSGTNLTANSYFEVTSVVVGTSITFSTNNAGASIATGVVANGTLNIGGSLLTLAKALAINANVPGNKVHWKNGTYTVMATTTLAVNGTPGAGGIVVEGYNAAHGDLGTAPIFTSATNGVSLITTAGVDDVLFRNISFTHTAGTRGNAFLGSSSTSNLQWERCTFDGCLRAVYGDNIVSFLILGTMTNCEVKNSTSEGIRAPIILNECHIHDNTGDGVSYVFNAANLNMSINASVIADNGGDGIETATAGATSVGSISITGSVIYSNTGDGVKHGNTGISMLIVRNSIITDNGGYGLNSSVAATVLTENYNAFYNNTSGARNNVATGANSVALTGDPFTNAAGDDYTLNNTASAGAACRAAGSPATLPGATGTGYRDIGAFQHQDAGGGGTSGGARTLNIGGTILTGI